MNQNNYRYQRNEPPPGGPTQVEVGLYVNEIYAVNQHNMDYTMNIYLRQQWVDKR